MSLEISEWAKTPKNAFRINNDIKTLVNDAINTRIHQATQRFCCETGWIAGGSLVLWAEGLGHYFSTGTTALLEIDSVLIVCDAVKNFYPTLLLKYDAYQFAKKLDEFTLEQTHFTPLSVFIEKSLIHLPERIKTLTTVADELTKMLEKTKSIETEIFGLHHPGV